MPGASGDASTSRDRAQRTALHYAALEGPIEEVQRLIDAGLNVNDPDDSDSTPLHFAAEGLHADIAALLLANGAQVDARNAFGATPLLEALSEVTDDDEGEVIRVLLDAGADPYAENDTGVSPRSLAERVSNFDLMRFFRDLG